MVRPTITRDCPAEVKALTAALREALADRDRARAIAVTLEQEVAAANAALWEAESRLDEVTPQHWPQDPEQTEPDHV